MVAEMSNTLFFTVFRINYALRNVKALKVNFRLFFEFYANSFIMVNFYYLKYSVHVPPLNIVQNISF